MTKKITWDEFRETGLLLIINQFLHIFGLAIVVEIGDDGGISTVYPARVSFRGFDEKSTEQAYQRVSKYIADNSDYL
jgi:hypothetical protein